MILSSTLIQNTLGNCTLPLDGLTPPSTFFVIHHPAQVYLWIFSINSDLKVSGHLGVWYWYTWLLSLMRGLCDLSLTWGEVFLSTPDIMSLYCFNHPSCSCGMSSLNRVWGPFGPGFGSCNFNSFMEVSVNMLLFEACALVESSSFC